MFKMGYIPTEEHRRRLSYAHLGKKRPPFSKETKIKMSKAKMGERNPNWNGGIKRQKRNDGPYYTWTKKVKERDKNICQLKDKNCSGYNIVHHIKGWLKYPKLRYQINNGITLCQAP